LKEFNIEPTEKFEVGKNDFTISNQNYSLKIADKKMGTDELYGAEVIQKLSIKLQAKGLGAKTLFTQNSKESRMLDAKVLGYLQSPFENRIVVLFSTKSMGYEGPPNLMEYKIIGATLDKGFK
jgi:hypothetical protein